MNSRPKYKYARRFSRWVVYRMEYSDSGAIGTPVADFATSQEAREKCLRLSGEAQKEREA